MTYQPRRSYESEEFYSERIRQAKSARRFHWIMGSVAAAALLGFIWLMIYVAKVASASHARFMDQCMQDHKEYECTAMWRAGDSGQPTVVFIPTGR